MLVAVFRARDDGERTARALSARGHQALLLPVMEIVATGAGLPILLFDVVVSPDAASPPSHASQGRAPPEGRGVGLLGQGEVPPNMDVASDLDASSCADLHLAPHPHPLRVRVPPPPATPLRSAQRSLWPVPPSPAVGRGGRAQAASVITMDQVPNAVIFTSIHGVEAVLADPTLDQFATTPCFCVGAQTARRAAEAGFADVRTAPGDADALAAQIIESFPAPSHFLFVTGVHRKPTVEQRLAEHGHIVTAIAVYEARAVARWDEQSLAPLRAGAVEAALHFSRRSVELALDRADQSGVGSAFLALTHHCIARDVATPLADRGARCVVAPEPTEASLLGTLP